MEIADVLQLIPSVGFPIVACICMGWYVKFQTENNSTEVKEMRQEHAATISKVTEALNNNTLALQQLVDKFDELKN